MFRVTMKPTNRCFLSSSTFHSTPLTALSEQWLSSTAGLGCSASETVGTNFPSRSFVVSGNNYGCTYLYEWLNVFTVSKTILKCSDDSECVKVVYVLWLLQWPTGHDLLCLRVCVYMHLSKCLCVFPKAKSWHFAQRVGWGKNTTWIYCSVLSLS